MPLAHFLVKPRRKGHVGPFLRTVLERGYPLAVTVSMWQLRFNTSW